MSRGLDDSTCAVSVIIPVYNRSSTIRRALRSVLAQDPLPEVIVVDDGSDQEFAGILADLSPSVTVLRLPENVGPGAARNVGVLASRGEWLVFLDSDDILVDGAIREFERLSQSEQVVDVLMAMAAYTHDPQGRRFSGLAGSFAVRRAAFYAIGGYDTLLRYAENSDLLDRLTTAANESSSGVACSAELVSLITQRSDPSVHYESRLQAVSHLTTSRPELARSERATLHGIGAVVATQKGARGAAIVHACRAIRNEPLRLRHYVRLGLVIAWPVGRYRWRRRSE